MICYLKLNYNRKGRTCVCETSQIHVTVDRKFSFETALAVELCVLLLYNDMIC